MRSEREYNNEEDVRELAYQITQLQIQQKKLKLKLARVQRQVDDGEVVDNTIDRQRDTYARDHRSGGRRRENINKNTVNTPRQVKVVMLRRQSEQKYNQTTEPHIGDQVQIINPRNGQHPWGTIEGFCAD